MSTRWSLSKAGRLPLYCRNVLEVICTNGHVKAWEMSDLSGYAGTSTHQAINCLSTLGLIERGPGAWRASEKGKIILALLIGKETRRRAKFQRAA